MIALMYREPDYQSRANRPLFKLNMEVAMKRVSLLIVLLILLVSATAVLAAPADLDVVSDGASLVIDGPDGQSDDIPVTLIRPVKSKFPPVLSCPHTASRARYIAPRCVWP